METRTEQIERLKNNKVAFGLMDEADQELIRDMFENNDKILLYTGGVWLMAFVIEDKFVYRITGNYTETPEVPTDIQDQIKNINKRLGELEESRGKLSKSDASNIFDRLHALEANQEIISKFSSRLVMERLDKIEQKLNEKGE